MIERVQTWMEQQLAEAEREKTCLVAQTPCELRRLRRAVTSGCLIEPAPSVFSRATYWTTLKPAGRMRHLMKALQKLHPTWVFAGPSAAVAFGLSVSNRYLDRAWVATSRKTHRRKLASRHTIVVSGDSPMDVDGVRLTSFARTVGDCLRVMDFRSGLAVADSALRVSGWTRDALMANVGRACAKMSGMQRMRHLVALSDARAESGGESIARATMLELGFALPDLQRPFDNPVVPSEPYRVDFVWDVVDRCILGELDGFEKYVNAEMTKGRSVAQVIEDEHRRQSCLEARPEVLRVIRFGFSDVMHDRPFLDLLVGCGVPRSHALDGEVQMAGGIVRCR